MVQSALQAVRRKKLIYTVTAGRTGTQYLARLLALAPGVASFHEPDPSFRQVMRAAIQDPGIARVFFLQLKFPHMAAAPGASYAETSHLFCKGFFVPLLQLGMRPGLVFLRRPPREVAMSLLARDTVPARTPMGNAYVFRPDDANVLPLPGWERLTDYQLCFWYALAIERRQRRYADFARMLGLPMFDTTAAELNEFHRFTAMLDSLGLPAAPEPQLERNHARLSAERHNANQEHPVAILDADRQEEEVWNRITWSEPQLRARVIERYGAGNSEVRRRKVRAA